MAADVLVSPHLQFVYDAWYGWVTPDVEFPADIRRALNSAFGNLAARARHVDLKAVLGCAAPSRRPAGCYGDGQIACGGIEVCDDGTGHNKETAASWYSYCGGGNVAMRCVWIATCSALPLTR